MGYGFIELSTISPSKVGQSKNFTKKTVNGLIDTNASVSCGHNIAMHAVKSKLNNDHSLLASNLDVPRGSWVCGGGTVEHYIFWGGGVLRNRELYTKKKCYYFQLKLIPSTYLVIVLSGLNFEGRV
jgi:hypothetical protein